MSQPSPSPVGQFLLSLFRFLFTIFAVATTLFIFSNSLEIAAVSSARSQALLTLVNDWLSRAGFAPLSEFLLRKLAHFSEYALLGFWLTLCLRVYTRHYWSHVSWPLFLTLVIANLDETLQTFVAGRAGSVRDVWIDFGGSITGIAVALFLISLLAGFWRLLGFGRS